MSGTIYLEIGPDIIDRLSRPVVALRLPKKTTSADEKATLTGYESSSNSAQSMVLVIFPFFS